MVSIQFSFILDTSIHKMLWHRSFHELVRYNIDTMYIMIMDKLENKRDPDKLLIE